MNRTPALEWARSGLMALTGAEDGPPSVPGVDVVGAIRALFEQYGAVAGGRAAELGAGVYRLTERARIMRLKRGGQVSCNRSCRLLEARDGWLALNLPRPSDIDLVRAWLGIEVSEADPWSDVAHAIVRRDLADLLAAAADLPLAVAAAPVRESAHADPPSEEVTNETSAPAPGASAADDPSPTPLVVDLSALWAGPLCGRLLALAGARVIKVESLERPEPLRQRWPAMFDRLHAGKESVVLDFADPSQLACLRNMLGRADIVIGSARPRAFEQLGLDPRDVLARNPHLAWVAITAHGWHGPDGQRIGFGDDAAVAAGLLTYDAIGRPQFVGDAIADPLTGVVGATAALRAWRRREGGLFDVSLRATAERIARARPLAPSDRGTLYRRGRGWWLQAGGEHCRVAIPMLRRPEGSARPFGADTYRILREFS